MFLRVTTCIIFLLTGVYVFAQYPQFNNSPIDTLVFKRGPKILLNDKKQTPTALVNLSNNYPEARERFKKARTNNAVQFVFSFAGGFLLGGIVYNGLSSKPINGGTVAACVGLLGVGIAFQCVTTNHLKKGVHLYNRGK